MEAKFNELGDEESDLTSSDSKFISGNSNLQYHNKPTSLNGCKMFNTDRGNSVKIHGMINPTGVVLY